jgi:hypothetical protein
MTDAELAPANDLLARPAALRARLEADGYLFLRALLPPAPLAGLREAILGCCRAGGHMVHRALPNRSPDRMRLSVDYRYQSRAEPISEKNLHPHPGAITWEEVYRGWTRTDLQRYRIGQRDPDPARRAHAAHVLADLERRLAAAAREPAEPA